MFGHQPPVYARKGWYSPGEEYGRVRKCGVDGIGREHAIVEAECARCRKIFNVARIHLPTTTKGE
jgi:hypothetical protein